MYQPPPNDAELWGEHYAHPSAHDAGPWVLAARYDGIGHGPSVEVYEARSPARFYRIVASPAHGEPGTGFVLETGTGVGVEALEKRLAEAVASGMLRAVADVDA